MNERTAACPVVDRQAAIERLDPIAQSGEQFIRRSAIDPDVEPQQPVRLDHADRGMGPA